MTGLIRPASVSSLSKVRSSRGSFGDPSVTDRYCPVGVRPPVSRNPDRAVDDRHGIEDEVVEISPRAEVLSRVVDYGVRSQRLHQFDVGSTAHAGDARAEVPRELDGGGTDRAGRAVDKDLLSVLDCPLLQVMQCQESAIGNRGRFLVARVGRLGCQQRAFRQAFELGICAKPKAIKAEDLVTRSERGHSFADRCNVSGQHHPKWLSWCPESDCDPHRQPQDQADLATPHDAVTGGHCRRKDPDAHLISPGSWGVDLSEPEYLGRAVFRANDSFHETPSHRSRLHGSTTSVAPTRHAAKCHWWSRRGEIAPRSVSVISLDYARPAATSCSRVRPASWMRSSWSSNQVPW